MDSQEKPRASSVSSISRKSSYSPQGSVAKSIQTPGVEQVKEDSAHTSCKWIVFNRWFTFLAGIGMTGISGTPLLFPVFLPYLQTSLNYKLSQVDSIATACNLGMSITLPIGFFFDRFGPRPTAILSGLLLFFGYFGIWLVTQRSLTTNYILVSVCASLVGLGSGASYTVAVPPNIHNFPKSSGKVVGVLASAFGLSAAFFTQIYNFAFTPNIPRFLLFLSITLGGVSIIGAIFINYVPKKQVQNTAATSEESPLIAYQFEEVEPQFNPLKMLATVEFYLFFFIFFFATGAQFTIVNNMGSLLESLGAKEGVQNRFVIIISVCNFIGTIFSGIISDVVSKKMSRPAFLTISVALLSIAFCYLGFSNVNMLYAGVALVGIAIGILWAMVPNMTHEIWGQKHWGFNYALLNLAPALASYLFATLLTSQLYQHFANKVDKTCRGADCYCFTFWVVSACCGLATILSIVLWKRTKEQYRRRYFRRETLHRLVN